VVTTAKDLSAFYRSLVTGKLLKPATVLTMAKPPVAGSTYGLGLLAVGDPCPGPDGKPGVALGHTGASLGTMSYAFTSPDGTRQVVLAYNGRDYTKDSTTFNDFLIAALQATCPTKAAPAPAKPAKPANPPSSAPPSTGLGDRAFPAPDVVGWRP
jgi:D-alanyl-D-alanine carboxypeptidase